jgi:hypothetical protein
MKVLAWLTADVARSTDGTKTFIKRTKLWNILWLDQSSSHK